ncbi:hypothetical protein MN608_09007 [Microdochium nivale]|nr:hypothetical protein MN608_09007 [Microdochium nivale]
MPLLGQPGVTVHDSAFKLLHNNADKHSAYLEFLVKHNYTVPRESSNRADEVTVLSEQLSLKLRIKRLKDRGYGGISRLIGSSTSVAAVPHGGVLGTGGLKRKERKLEKRESSESCKVSGTHVKFSVPLPTAPEPRTVAPSTDIGDLCTIVTAPDHITDSKYLGEFDLAPLPFALSLYSHSSQRHDSSAHTVGDFLRYTPKRHDRLKLGLKIMLTVLGLGASWVPETLSKQSMFLFDPAATQESEIIPFLLSESKQNAIRQKQRDAGETAKKVLLAVGILLLELLFQETIESRSDRPLYLSSGQSEELANLFTAISWQQTVEAEYGSKISEAIRQCVVCGFGIPAPNLGDRAFLQAVWLGVVQPLEDFLKAYA